MGDEQLDEEVRTFVVWHDCCHIAWFVVSQGTVDKPVHFLQPAVQTQRKSSRFGMIVKLDKIRIRNERVIFEEEMCFFSSCSVFVQCEKSRTFRFTTMVGDI